MIVSYNSTTRKLSFYPSTSEEADLLRMVVPCNLIYDPKYSTQFMLGSGDGIIIGSPTKLYEHRMLNKEGKECSYYRLELQIPRQHASMLSHFKRVPANIEAVSRGVLITLDVKEYSAKATVETYTNTFKEQTSNKTPMGIHAALRYVNEFISEHPDHSLVLEDGVLHIEQVVKRRIG